MPVIDIIDARSAPARVLVVEDEALIQMLATEYLEECGLKVDMAGSATEADRADLPHQNVAFTIGQAHVDNYGIDSAGDAPELVQSEVYGLLTKVIKATSLKSCRSSSFPWPLAITTGRDG